ECGRSVHTVGEPGMAPAQASPSTLGHSRQTPDFQGDPWPTQASLHPVPIFPWLPPVPHASLVTPRLPLFPLVSPASTTRAGVTQMRWLGRAPRLAMTLGDRCGCGIRAERTRAAVRADPSLTLGSNE
uniref:Uncharacterized protein n=1 Tax=Ursus americanus TaxID=9643 RepID=A0A452S4M6_URSAM